MIRGRQQGAQSSLVTRHNMAQFRIPYESIQFKRAVDSGTAWDAAEVQLRQDRTPANGKCAAIKRDRSGKCRPAQQRAASELHALQVNDLRLDREMFVVRDRRRVLPIPVTLSLDFID